MYSIDMLLKTEKDNDRVDTLFEMSQKYGPLVNSINRRIGTSMHHDTITGTSPIGVMATAQQDITKILTMNTQ